MNLILLIWLMVLIICGTTAIFNGRPANRAPYHAFVSYVGVNGKGYYGGGSLITNMHVITAGHMVEGFNRWTVGLGGNGDYGNLRLYETTHAHLHPNYDRQTPRDADIAIIQLPQSIIFSVEIAPIALPGIGTHMPYEYEQGLVLGYGQTEPIRDEQNELLMSAWIRTMSDQMCRDIFGITIPNHFCASDLVRQTNICNGDLGGGVAMSVYGIETLVGVNSIVMTSCSADAPSAFTRVSVYRQWIRSITSV